MRGVADAFDKALRGVKTLLKYNINITALLTLTSYNIDSVIPTLSFYKEIGLKNATIMLLCPAGRAKTNV
jgi:MoaA/NifB/PqqE/SkfB family radical SAM enzyme